MKIGMLTSGGDCQGLNAALRGVAKALYQEFGTAVTIYGIRDGYRGLIEGDYHPMEPQDFSDILTRGGTILGTSRQPFKTMQQAEENEATKLEKNARYLPPVPALTAWSSLAATARTRRQTCFRSTAFPL